MVYDVRLVGQLARVYAVIGAGQARRVYGLVGALGVQNETGHVAGPRGRAIVFEPAKSRETGATVAFQF